MRKLLIVVLLLVSASAYAGMWRLVYSEFVGNGWMCTYRLEGTQYTSTTYSKSFCQSYIYQ